MLGWHTCGLEKIRKKRENDEQRRGLKNSGYRGLLLEKECEMV